jgi:hypothetical protein
MGGCHEQMESERTSIWAGFDKLSLTSVSLVGKNKADPLKMTKRTHFKRHHMPQHQRLTPKWDGFENRAKHAEIGESHRCNYGVRAQWFNSTKQKPTPEGMGHPSEGRPAMGGYSG